MGVPLVAPGEVVSPTPLIVGRKVGRVGRMGGMVISEGGCFGWMGLKVYDMKTVAIL